MTTAAAQPPTVVSLADKLAQWKTTGVSIFPVPGNGGDALIAEATLRLFDRHGISFRILPSHHVEIPPVAHVVIGGGGNLTGDYPHASRFIDNVHSRVASLTVLPHSYRGNEDLFARLGANTTLFARERKSWEHIRQFPNLGGIGLEDDLALTFADTPGFLASIRRRRFLALRRFAKIQSLKLKARKSGAATRFLELNSFRDDVESAAQDKPADNLDLSKQINYDSDMQDRALVQRTVFYFFATIAWFSSVNTDRLHVAIAASLLGKPVNLFEGSYWKAREVYRQSLKDRFPRLRVHPHPWPGK